MVKKINGDKSCTICGFFVQNPTENNAGYCLCYDDVDKPGESLKVPHGEEKNQAKRCRDYFRQVKGMSTAEFLNWRTNMSIARFQVKVERLGILLAIISAVTGIIQAVGVSWDLFH